MTQSPPSRAVSPATIRVKSKPFFTDFRWTWFGRVAKPTYCFSWSCRAEVDGSRSGCATPPAQASHSDRELDSKSPRQTQGLEERSVPALAVVRGRARSSSRLRDFCPSHRWAQRATSFPAAALLGCSHQPTQQFTAASQYRRHKGKGTSCRSHQRAHLGLLLTHNLPNSLLLLHSCRLPSQQGHQMSPLPRSFRVISTSLPPEVRAVLHLSLLLYISLSLRVRYMMKSSL